MRQLHFSAPILAFLVFYIASLIAVCRAAVACDTVKADCSVLNLQFVDQDNDAGQMGGTIFWDKPALGDDGYNYVAYLATSSDGTTKTQLPLSGAIDLPGGADVSAFPVPMDTAIGSNTHIIVYLKSHDTNALSNPVSICIIDKPGGFVRTVYMTTTGYTKANNARTALATGCHASLESITLEMVATAKWTGSAVSETTFDDANEQSNTASFLLTFPTGSTFTNIETAITSFVDDCPIPAVFTGTGADTDYSQGEIRSATVMDDFVPNRPDPDIARYIARSSVHFHVAGSVIVNRNGWAYIQTKTDKQTAAKQMAEVYLNTDAVTFSNIGAATSTKTAIATGATAAQALCYQVTGSDSQPSCLSPYTV